MTTTIQIGQDVAEALRVNFPGTTYDQAVRQLLSRTVKDSRTLFYSRSVAALTQVNQVRNIRSPGYVVAAYFHFPSGANGLVDVRVMKLSGGGDEAIIPDQDNTFIALNDMTLPMTGLAIPVKPNDKVRVEWWNYDGGFAHTIPVELVLLET